ncbi:MAG: Amuc_1099 family pilus-like system protein [Chthoniobacteraceae bacterium]
MSWLTSAKEGRTKHMDWIKKRYDQFVLLLATLLLLGVSGLLALRAKSFPDKFAAALTTVVPSEKIPELDLTLVKSAEARVADPARWSAPKGVNEFMFAPDLYMIDKDTQQPKKPTDGSLYNDSLTGKPIPNRFFTSHNLPLLDSSVPKQDPDKDGFTNEDEWRGERDGADPSNWHDSTDPNDAAAHPAVVTKLYLKQWIRVRFRLLFQAYDGDPAKPEEMSFQINAVDRGRKTEFLKIGQKVAGSPYRLEKFELKMKVNPSTGSEEDVSELTILNTETNDTVVLVKAKETDSPDSYALFDYQLFPTAPNQFTSKDIQVKKLQEFVLLPDKTKLYKLVDIKEGQAVIQLPDGAGTYLVTPDPRKK